MQAWVYSKGKDLCCISFVVKMVIGECTGFPFAFLSLSLSPLATLKKQYL